MVYDLSNYKTISAKKVFFSSISSSKINPLSFLPFTLCGLFVGQIQKGMPASQKERGRSPFNRFRWEMARGVSD